MSYDFDYYNARDIVYPTKPAKPRLANNPTAADARAYADALEAYEVAFKEYERERTVASSLAGKRLTEFEDRLKEDYGLSNDEFSVIWGEAYNRGHHAGLHEVYTEFDSLVDFVHRYVKSMKGI